jgi:hypothetical protein
LLIFTVLIKIIWVKEIKRQRRAKYSRGHLVKADRGTKRKLQLRRKKLRKVWEYGSMGVWEYASMGIYSRINYIQLFHLLPTAKR